MVKSFSAQCELSNVSVTPLHGLEGAERFWRDYLATFAEVHTRFLQVVECGKTAYLEWRSEGRLASGKPLSYEGITMIQADGERIVRFKAYHDSAVFLASGGKHADRITGLKGGRSETPSPDVTS